VLNRIAEYAVLEIFLNLLNLISVDTNIVESIKHIDTCLNIKDEGKAVLLLSGYFNSTVVPFLIPSLHILPKQNAIFDRIWQFPKSTAANCYSSRFHLII
jgi:hypothetical protein